MSTNQPRLRFATDDQIIIRGIEYRYISTSDSAYVFQRTDSTALNIHMTFAEYMSVFNAGMIQYHQRFYSSTPKQTPGVLTPLLDLNLNRSSSYLWRLEWVERTRQGIALGRWTRSTAGFMKAVEQIPQDIAEEQGFARQVAEARAAALAREDLDISREINPHAPRRKKRWDAPAPNTPDTSPVRAIHVPSVSALRKLVRRYEKSGLDPASLRDRYGNCGRSSPIHPDVERLIEESFANFMTERRGSIRFSYRHFLIDLAVENQRRQNLGMEELAKPSEKTFRRRRNQIPAFARLRAREGYEAARNKFAPSSGGLTVRCVGERLEIDEWLTHVFVVDGEIVRREDVKKYGERCKKVRLWAAVVIDSFSRYVVGLSLSETANPSNVLNALRMAVSNRAPLAKAVGAESPWGPFGGLMEVASDSGTSFNEQFRAAVADLGGSFQYGPAKHPRLRSRLERMFRTLHEAFLPHYTGRTFSNPQQRGSYDPEQRASATVAQFTQQFCRYIVDVYHNSPHEGLNGRTPRAVWEEGCAEYGLPAPPDPNRMRATLGERHDRKISSNGVEFASIFYNSSRLQEFWRTHGDRLVTIAVDSTDINRISVKLGEDWHSLSSRDDLQLQGTPLNVWLSVRRDLRRQHGAEAALSEDIVLRALESIRRTNAEDVIKAGIGPIQPSQREIDLDENRLRIGWREPQQLSEGASIADRDLKAWPDTIPFTGATSDQQAESGTEPNEEARSAKPPVRPNPLKGPSDDPDGWLDKGDDSWTREV